MMKYNSYLADVEYDDTAKIFHGEVLGIRDVITFQGKSVDELEKAFHDSVDDYLVWCKERGEEPERTFSGKLQLRLTPELHRKLSVEARAQDMSLNAYIMKKLK